MTKPRHVRGLVRVEILERSPFGGARKLTGRQAEGKAYQNHVHAEMQKLPDVTVIGEPWFRFHDTYGAHCCSPDHLIVADDRVLIVESKLSARRLETAVTQLTKLYRPVIEHLFQRPILMLVAFKHWHGPIDSIQMVEHPSELLTGSPHHAKQPLAWHYL